MQIVGASNIKGGVGKTTTAVNLAFLAASTGRRTVLWDLDPQGAATYLLDGEANERASARKLVRGRRGLQEILAPTRFENLALLPADTSFRNFDIHMNAEKHPTRRLMMMVRPLQWTGAGRCTSRSSPRRGAGSRRSSRSRSPTGARSSACPSSGRLCRRSRREAPPR